MTSTAPLTAPISLDQISLRVTRKDGADRGFLVGGSGSGKSTLADLLGAEFVHRYYGRGGRRLILDSKPRYRAQWTVSGTSAARRYKRWAHGQPIPGSVVVDTPADLTHAFALGHRTVIAQCEDSRELPRLVATAAAFLRDARASRPQLIQVDETMDFYHGNGMPRGGDDTITKFARAGRERGNAVLYCSQRTKSIPATLMSELNRLYALQLDYLADAKRLQEMGCPPFELPQRPYEFRYWFKGDRATVFGPYRLDIP